MNEIIIDEQILKTATTEYKIQVYKDEDGLFKWRVMWGQEVTGTCNQGYKVKSSCIANIKRQAEVLALYKEPVASE